MADIFGFGSHALPKLPFFGPWQARGVVAGQILIALGFLMLLPFQHREEPVETRPGDPGVSPQPKNDGALIFL